MCEECERLEKRIRELEQFNKQPFSSAPPVIQSMLYCDGYYCEQKLTCGKYSVKPVEKAAYWARKSVDAGSCNHYSPVL